MRVATGWSWCAGSATTPGLEDTPGRLVLASHRGFTSTCMYCDPPHRAAVITLERVASSEFTSMYGMVRFRIRNPPIGFVAKCGEGIGSLLPVALCKAYLVKHVYNFYRGNFYR